MIVQLLCGAFAGTLVKVFVGNAADASFAAPAPASAVLSTAAGECTSNARTACGCPSCNTVKSPAVRSFTGRPWLSVTTTSNCTRRVLTLMVAAGLTVAAALEAVEIDELAAAASLGTAVDAAAVPVEAVITGAGLAIGTGLIGG